MGDDGLATVDEQQPDVDTQHEVPPVAASEEEGDPFADEGPVTSDEPGFADGDEHAATMVIDAEEEALEPLADEAAELGLDESVRIPPITLTPEVSARICDCLRAAIDDLDQRLAHARALGEREAFYGGWAAVLEQRRARYAAALTRTLPAAEGAQPLAIG